METIFTPNHSNISMGPFERNFIYSCLPTFSNFYCGFIDAIFLPYNGKKIISFYEKVKL